MQIGGVAVEVGRHPWQRQIHREVVARIQRERRVPFAEVTGPTIQL